VCRSLGGYIGKTYNGILYSTSWSIIISIVNYNHFMIWWYEQNSMLLGGLGFTVDFPMGYTFFSSIPQNPRLSNMSYIFFI
jgi:hypothetical protein